MAAVDADVLLKQITLHGKVRNQKLLEAITAPPELTRTVDGATTLTVEVNDASRLLIRDGIFDTRSWAVVDGLHFELVQVKKSGDRVTLTFEDAVVAALRRRTSHRTFKAGSATRQQIARHLADEAGVAISADPEHRAKVADAVERSGSDQKSSSWDVLGTIAEAVDWRRFSDGKRLVIGSDAWLKTRLTAITLSESTASVQNVDFDHDVGKPASRATVTVDTTKWGLPPAQPIRLKGMGPANGLWLLESFTRTLTRTTGTLELVRSQASLDEPKGTSGDAGESDFLPDDTSSSSTSLAASASGHTPLAKMLAYALKQRGKHYVWGASGPNSFDCSGLVQQATHAGGKTLTKPVSSQWATCRRQGKTISVAQGLRTRGALLFRIGGEYNHVAISLGDGRTMEARGTAYGVNVFSRASHGGWTGAAMWFPSK